MSYLVGTGLIIIGLIILVGGANMELQIIQEADRTSTDALDYMKKLESSDYAFSIGLMAVGGALMIGGAFSIAKNRRGNNYS